MKEEWSFQSADGAQVPIIVGIDPDNRIGQGAQGTVYQTEYVQQQGSRRRAPELLLKIYDGMIDPDQQTRMKIFCGKLDSLRGLRTGPLLGLPSFPVVSSKGDVAVFMTRVPGTELGTSQVGDALLRSNLAERLHYAWQLADAVAKLHAGSILHADITMPNIMMDPGRHAVYLIDVDGGGILAPGGFAMQLAPVTKYRETEPDVFPPELRRDEHLLPNIASDNWALSVTIFRILTSHMSPGGLTPFQIYENEQLRLLYEINATKLWPSAADVGPWWKSAAVAGGSPMYDQLMKQVGALGAPVKDLFSSTFGRGRLASHLRPHSKAWCERLDEARRWAMECVCGKESVAAGRTHCLWCGTTIKHPVWRVISPDRDAVAIERDQQILPGVFLKRTERGTYIAESQQPDTRVNNAHQTHELHSGRHVLSVTKLDRPIAWKGELSIP